MADGITRIAVEGFKSIANRQQIEIAPLTILAGANSSGKSSIMQPLLMLKQTLEAQYDPGPLLIYGPNVKFTSTKQFLSRTEGGSPGQLLSLEIETGYREFDITFSKGAEQGMEVLHETRKGPEGTTTLRENMPSSDIPREFGEFSSLIRDRFFLDLNAENKRVSLMRWLTPLIIGTIHVPGLRGNPSRTHPVAAVGPTFPGTFENYTASVILSWQKENSSRYEDLNVDLQCIGLARNVFAHRVDDATIELLVNRAEDYPNDMVSIADVGFGVSQTLPVLVALRAAELGQLVYLEEPEIHLHPRAQVKLADILADAAKRGVRIVAETHSSLLLRAIQTLIAKGTLPPGLVCLHWFSRDNDGVTNVRSAAPDENGAFGDWPEDFGDVALQSEKEYLDAVESKLAR